MPAILQVTANDIVLEGRNPQASSGIFASAVRETGNGGTIIINSRSLQIRNGATINASNFPQPQYK